MRAGLVIGPQGSSFRIVERLVRRLPLMIAPSWTQTPTQPIALADLIAVLAACLGDARAVDRVVEVGGADILSYRELMAQTAAALGVRRRILSVGAFAPSLSTLWVWLITRVPMQLTRPLVQSLKSPLVAHDPLVPAAARAAADAGARCDLHGARACRARPASAADAA